MFYVYYVLVYNALFYGCCFLLFISIVFEQRTIEY